jgi:serine/threonine protein kinase
MALAGSSHRYADHPIDSANQTRPTRLFPSGFSALLALFNKLSSVEDAAFSPSMSAGDVFYRRIRYFGGSGRRDFAAKSYHIKNMSHHTAATEGLTIFPSPSCWQLRAGRCYWERPNSGRNTSNGEWVVIKVISHAPIMKANRIRRLRREVQTLLELDHPNVCKCHEVFKDADRRKTAGKNDCLRAFHDIAEGLNCVYRH